MEPWVLVVDDEEMIRENLIAFLEDEGMRVMAVESAEEALHRVRDGCPFAVCIMDMRLPGMDGNAAIRALHARCPELEFIIHTGSSNYALPGDLRELGMSDERVYLKPLDDMTPLAAAVRRLAGWRSGG
ncbi:MAG: response regulator [Pseudomonadota bacterium]|nr:response regulator [Pseudomonadota bacterium]